MVKGLALAHLPARLLWRLKLRHYTRVLRDVGPEEEPDLALLPFFVEPGAMALDIGANIGVYTKALSRLTGPQGQVISVEPIPETFAILVHNLKVFGLKNATPLNVAVSDSTSVLVMEVPEYKTGGENYYQAHVVTDVNDSHHGPRRRVKVNSRTLDDIAHGTLRVSFVKCDVEGHELACLRGAQWLLREQKPVWLLEVQGDPDVPQTNAAKVFEVLSASSYRAWIYDGSSLRPRRFGDASVNYFFLTPEHQGRLARLGAPILATTE